MRVGRSSNKVTSLRLDSAAQAAASAIRANGDNAHTLGRFLVRLGDALQSAVPAAAATARPSAPSPSRIVRDRKT
jgi:hypothetical protein